MPISYSGITNYGKATLPSVEGGLGSMVIQKDPPKSIMTRRIDKVGQTSSLTELCDQSGDRVCEAINVYARGVNPFVSVSYSNHGNNGGQRSQSAFGGKLGGTHASLPYRIMRDGVFRPPVLTQEQLMPLSRQPRTTTDAFTNAGFVDFSKKLLCPGTKYREVKENTIKTCVRPTATYRLDKPIEEPFEVKYVIKNPTKFDKGAGYSGVRTRDLTTQNVIEPGKGIYQNPLHAEALSNKSGETVRYADLSNTNTERYLQNTLHSNVQINRSGETVRYVDNSHFNTDSYLQNPLHSSVQSNKSHSIQITPIEDIINVDIHTKDPINVSYKTPITGHNKQNYIHDDIILQRRNPSSYAQTNKKQNIYIRHQIENDLKLKRNLPQTSVTANYGTIQRQTIDNLSSRDYKLKPTINAGSFEGKASLPLNKRMVNINSFETDKQKMGRQVMEMQHSRVFK
jgi:hypothetical protein